MMDGTHTRTCPREKGNLETKTKDKSGFETVATVRKAEIFQAKHIVFFGSVETGKVFSGIAPKKIETETVAGQWVA